MEINTTKLREKIQNNEKVIVDFWASWCSPCRMMKPVFEGVSKQFESKNSEVQFFTYNIDQDMEYVSSLQIRGVPTIKAFNMGKEVFSQPGIMREEQIKNLAETILNG